jgi:3-deoxy-D-manno-octulosonic-acid transferase
MRLLYSALFYCLLPLIVLRMLWRSRRAPAYRRRLPERFGLFTARPEPEAPAIWVHAVSVGETVAAASLVEHLLQAYPAYRVVLTTTTPTGSERARALFGDRVFHVYAPWDLPGPVRRFLHRTRPQLLLIMETELWPNMLHYSQLAGCRILLANARMSERSARGYARLGGLTRQMMVQLDAVACQTTADGQRFLDLGLPPAALQVTGSVKFDLVLDDELRARAGEVRRSLGGERRPVVLAASTHAGEEALILSAFAEVRRSYGDCLLVLVPRHPERFEEVHSLCCQRGWQVVRRSTGLAPTAGDDILLGDTMGELLLLLGVATVAIMGGSLVEHGGHNVLEAAAWGAPVVTGPYMHNFVEASELLIAAGAMVSLDRPSGLAACLLELLGDPERRERMAATGRQVMAENRGASQRLSALVAQQLVKA